MTIDINQFWNLLSESQLAPAAQIQTLFTEYASDPKLSKRPEDLAKWVVNRGALSPYQAEILLAGHAGPFDYGTYSVVDRMSEGALEGCYTARHKSTSFPVMIRFVEGKSDADLETWNRIEARCRSLTSSAELSRFLIPLFESVVTPAHRFIVFGLPAGKTIDRLPRKSRLPWKQACGIGAMVAHALQSLHDQDLLHGGLSGASVWLGSGGEVGLLIDPLQTETDFHSLSESDQLGRLCWMAPEVEVKGRVGLDNAGNADVEPITQPELNPAAEVYSLGCLLVRLITARPYCSETDPKKIKAFHQASKLPDFDKYDLSDDLKQLVTRLLAKDPSARPSMSEAANLLALYSGRAAEIDAPVPSNKASELRSKYEATLTQFLPGKTDDQDQPPIALNLEEESDGNELSADERIQAAREKAAQRKKQKWKTPALVALGILLLASVIGAFAYWGNQQEVVKQGPADGEKVNGTETVPKNQTAGLTPTSTGSLTQILVEDDENLLWETPTTGLPSDFSYLPNAPKMLLRLRASLLNGDAEGKRLLKSFGPDLAKSLDSLESRIGVGLKDIDELIVSFHDRESDGEFRYETFFVVTLVDGVEETRLMELWRQPTPKATDGGGQFLASGEDAFFITSRTPAGDDGTVVTQFAAGTVEAMQQVVDLPGGVPLSGAMKNVAAWTDRDRHLDFLFLRPFLFNDHGQQWMGESLAGFNRELSVVIPDGVRAGLVGFHIERGNYLELRFDRIPDLSNGVLKQSLENDMRTRRDQLTDYVAQIFPNTYWDRVRVKYAGMIADATRNFRWSVEDGEVVGNVWLPPMAAHNLVASSELILSFANGSGAQSATENKSVPQSLEELLAAKRDLEITNPPDLNVLMVDLKTEIESDYGKLPFQWDIKLMGGDLEAEGITKNQRPGELIMKQMTFSEILTAIMISANPSKDITGASDPECKLVWVVVDDPDNPNQKSILITTRTAAAEKSYTLPPPFVE